MLKAGSATPLVSLRKQVGEVVIEREWDRDQHRADHQHGERAILHQGQRVQPEDVADGDLLARRFGRGGGQRERVQAQQQRGGGADLHRQGGSFDLGIPGLENLADEDAGHDPADGAQHADTGEFAARVLHLVERDGVDQREGRHVQGGVGQHGPEERSGRGHGRGVIQQSGAHDVQHAQHLLRREEAVGHHADEERRDDRAPVRGAVGIADVDAGKAEFRQVTAHRHHPGAPDEELEKHHRRQLDADLGRHA